MTAYGDDATIMQMLGPGGASAGFSEALEARVAAMNGVVSTLVEEKTGRQWSSGAPSPIARTIYQTGGYSDVLVLPVPAISISAITVDQTDAGGVLSGGTVLDVSSWWIQFRNARGEITAIRTGYRSFWTYQRVVTITGVWADTVQTVPDDIVWAVNHITAERIKQEQASPAGFIGPDGTVAPIRDPWADPQVKAIITRHRLTGKGLVL